MKRLKAVLLDPSGRRPGLTKLIYIIGYFILMFLENSP
jgi:hypothetical protein